MSDGSAEVVQQWGFLGGVCKTILNVKKSGASQVNLNSWIGGIPGLAGRIILRRLLDPHHR